MSPRQQRAPVGLPPWDVERLPLTMIGLAHICPRLDCGRIFWTTEPIGLPGETRPCPFCFKTNRIPEKEAR